MDTPWIIKHTKLRKEVELFNIPKLVYKDSLSFYTIFYPYSLLCIECPGDMSNILSTFRAVHL